MADTTKVRVEACLQAVHFSVLGEANRLLLKIHGDVYGHGGIAVPLDVEMG
jgi:hypothetical protein